MVSLFVTGASRGSVVRRSGALRITDARPPDHRDGAHMGAGAVVAYLASAVLMGWGTAHLAPTRAVAASFGEITRDNRRILVMEWMAEGVTHISLGILIVLITVIEGVSDPATRLVYRVVAAVLLVLAALTAATGSRTRVVWFRICPFVLSGAAALLVVASID